MEILIHVGPPKTGTSFIQQWCSRHKEWLLLHGVFYPEHHMDRNLISSGNLLSLFENDGDNCLTFSTTRLESAKKEAERLNAEKILFSSEYFFDHMGDLLTQIPNAKFVLYLRNELEAVESSHNQSVKRHFKTTPFKDIHRPISTTLRKILKCFQTHPTTRFLLRFYSDDMFIGGNIVADLLSTIGLNTDKLVVQSRIVNSSYSSKALELKRALNFYKDRAFHDALDEYLQNISEESQKYSLLSEKGYNHAKSWYLKQTREFFDEFPHPDGQEFIYLCENAQQPTRRPQFIRGEDVTNLIKGWLHFHPKIEKELNALCQYAKRSNLEHNQINVVNTVESVLQDKRYMPITNIISKATGLRRFRRTTHTPNESLDIPTQQQKLTLGLPSKTYPEIKVISHHIPKTAGSSFGQALVRAYGRENIFGVYKDTGAHLLTSGQEISLPQNITVLHGHFASHKNHKFMFPNAKHICWVRDPAERLWSLTKHIIRNSKPSPLYQNLLKYGGEETNLDLLDCFSLVLTKPEFEVVRNNYQKYFEQLPPTEFDFIGSTHRFEEGLIELEELLNVPLENLRENIAPDKESLVCTYPETYQRAKRLLVDEFKLIEQYC